MAELHGYSLILACTKCGLKKRIRHFPTQAAPALGTILGSEAQAIWEYKGCIRCGTCQFEVLTAPKQPPPPPPPVGWTRG